jgi:hypothetical protein
MSPNVSISCFAVASHFLGKTLPKRRLKITVFTENHCFLSWSSCRNHQIPGPIVLVRSVKIGWKFAEKLCFSTFLARPSTVKISYFFVSRCFSVAVSFRKRVHLLGLWKLFRRNFGFSGFGFLEFRWLFRQANQTKSVGFCGKGWKLVRRNRPFFIKRSGR